jgi:disulfide bond formation protein DsbB
MLAPSVDQGSPHQGSAGALKFWHTDPALAAALIVAVVGALTIAGAWFFELVIKLKPCPLCLEQRWPYYIGIPLALVVALAAWCKTPRMIVIGGLVAFALVMLWGAYLGGFHAGVEWKLWEGPRECTGTPEFGGPGGLLDRLRTINITRCDEAAWRFLGISFAGYNALISLSLCGVALLGAAAAARKS